MKRYREKAVQRYETMLAVTQTDMPGGKKAVMRYYRKNLLPHLPEVRDSSILDLGCGSGLFLEFLATEGFRNVRGVDVCSEHIRSCMDSGSSATLEDNMSFLARHVESFDCIVMNHVLEHFDKDEGLDLLDAVFASLNPGGRVIVVCPNMGNPFTAGRGRYADLTHETGYTEESLQFMLQLAGGEQVSLHGINIYCLSNSVANAVGKLAWALLSLFFRLIYLLNGVQSTTVLTKNMLALARKPSN